LILTTIDNNPTISVRADLESKVFVDKLNDDWNVSKGGDQEAESKDWHETMVNQLVGDDESVDGPF
jgi:hypothetical protein